MYIYCTQTIAAERSATLSIVLYFYAQGQASVLGEKRRATPRADRAARRADAAKSWKDEADLAAGAGESLARVRLHGGLRRQEASGLQDRLRADDEPPGRRR